MSYAGFFQAGSSYAPGAAQGNDVTDALSRSKAMAAYRQGPDYEREMFERNMMMGEQKRRQYDSETARQSQDRKFGVLSSLLGGSGGPPSPYGATGMRPLMSKRVGPYGS